MGPQPITVFIADTQPVFRYGLLRLLDGPVPPPEVLRTVRAVVADCLSDFPGPVLFGLPSGHTPGATLTLPFGVESRVVARGEPVLVIEEAAVS